MERTCRLLARSAVTVRSTIRAGMDEQPTYPRLTRLAMAVATPALLAATLPSCARQPTQLEAAITWADSALARAVADERVPGAVLLIAQNGRVIHERAYGYARLYEYSEPKLGGREHAVAERRAAPTGEDRKSVV